MADFPKIDQSASFVIIWRLIKTTKRLTFEIAYMHDSLIYKGEDDGNYFKFVASNGTEIISRSRMDIQTERLWLLGARSHTAEGARSGTMVFDSDSKRDAAFDRFEVAIKEWISFVRS